VPLSTSGSQAGSAGSAAAAQAAGLKDPKSVAPVKPSNQKPPATVDNEVHMQFRDGAGKPLEGVYFTLKDETSALRCVIWRFKRSRLDEWMDRQSDMQAAESEIDPRQKKPVRSAL